MKLPIGTKVRVTDSHSHYYGQTAWIEGDNEFTIAFAISIDSPIMPDFHYHYYVETSDGQDIEHGYSAPQFLERIRE